MLDTFLKALKAAENYHSFYHHTRRYAEQEKYCQRHNGPRVLSLKLEFFLDRPQSLFRNLTDKLARLVISTAIDEYKFNSVKKIIQVIDSIPWVRCASGNVLILRSILLDFEFFFF